MAILTSIEGGKKNKEEYMMYTVFYMDGNVESFEAEMMGSPDDGIIDAVIFFNDKGMFKFIPTERIHHVDILQEVR